ncbi:MAG: DUF1385 domain-containing protein, partial [Firmicutes bacterium]|nr:DUF1385 domain-containing protein [Bacillota bacterium]
MKNACPTKVGGQAILEGLMMRGSRALAIAIRQPDGDIHLTVEPLKKAGGWKKIPVVRGVGSFVSSLVTGTSVLMYGADVLERLEAAAGSDMPAENTAKLAGAGSESAEGAAADKPVKPGKQEQKGIPKSAVLLSVALALVLVVALFVLLPTFILGLIRKAGVESVLLLNLIEGIIRI